ncbi:MAG: hypothetical protein PHD48_05050 [Alphaproteobacteria bacterium]|nr:hypothetical protein [Alphaproteobacteria bacterium]
MRPNNNTLLSLFKQATAIFTGAFIALHAGPAAARGLTADQGVTDPQTGVTTFKPSSATMAAYRKMVTGRPNQTTTKSHRVKTTRQEAQQTANLSTGTVYPNFDGTGTKFIDFAADMNGHNIHATMEYNPLSCEGIVDSNDLRMGARFHFQQKGKDRNGNRLIGELLIEKKTFQSDSVTMAMDPANMDVLKILISRGLAVGAAASEQQNAGINRPDRLTDWVPVPSGGYVRSITKWGQTFNMFAGPNGDLVVGTERPSPVLDGRREQASATFHMLSRNPDMDIVSVAARGHKQIRHARKNPGLKFTSEGNDVQLRLWQTFALATAASESSHAQYGYAPGTSPQESGVFSFVAPPEVRAMWGMPPDRDGRLPEIQFLRADVPLFGQLVLDPERTSRMDSEGLWTYARTGLKTVEKMIYDTTHQGPYGAAPTRQDGTSHKRTYQHLGRNVIR